MAGAPRYKTVAIPPKLWDDITRVVEASGAYTSEAEFVREAVREKLQRVSVAETRSLSEGELRSMIVDYIRSHGVAYPSDIAVDLGAPYFTITEVIDRLVKEGLLEPAEERG